MSWMSHTMWLGRVSEFLSKHFLANVLWSHYHCHKTRRNSHTLIGWLLDGNRKGQSLSLSWRNMASERRVRSNLWMGQQPVVLRRSFHPFPQHGGTSIHKVDVVGEKHGCSTSHRSHDQDTWCAEECATGTLYKFGEVLQSFTYFSKNKRGVKNYLFQRKIVIFASECSRKLWIVYLSVNNSMISQNTHRVT